MMEVSKEIVEKMRPSLSGLNVGLDEGVEGASSADAEDGQQERSNGRMEGRWDEKIAAAGKSLSCLGRFDSDQVSKLSGIRCTTARLGPSVLDLDSIGPSRTHSKDGNVLL